MAGMGNGERDNALREWWDVDEPDLCTCGPMTRANGHCSCEPSSPPSVLHEAIAITEERGRSYGHPADNHSCTASLVSAYLERKYGLGLVLDAEDVCWFNILQKISREANSPKHDNLCDVAGFVKNIDDIRRHRL